MKRRVLASLVTVLYLSAVMVLGVHHHHDRADALGHDSHCAACQWHLQSNAQAPPGPDALPFLARVSVQVLIPIGAPIQTPFLPSADSRAPPIASA